MGKATLCFLVVACLLFIHRRTNFYDDQWLHYPPSEAIGTGDNSSNSLKQGPFSEISTLSAYERLSRKKINNYFFTIDNKHKLEIAIVDLGYVRSVSASYFAENRTYHFDRENIPFSLPESLAEPMNISHPNLTLTTQGLTTSLFLHLEQSGVLYSLNLTYLQPHQGCVTYLRKEVISYKCYAGSAQGTFQLKYQQDNYEVDLTLNKDNSLGGFDGLRGSGWQWKWIWGMGQTVSGNDVVSINLGSIEGIGEDVLQVGQRVIPIKGIQYSLNENSTPGDSFLVTSTEPQLNLQFKITTRDHRFRDLVVLKLDLLRFDGYWSGSFVNPFTQKQQMLDPFPGLVETGDNIF